MPKCDEAGKERARCLSIVMDHLKNGFLAATASAEFSDGYSVCAQEIACEISRGEEVTSQE